MIALSHNQIESLASRKNVRRIAVENFLCSITANVSVGDALQNMFADAHSYGWNAATVKAITDGIKLAR